MSLSGLSEKWQKNAEAYKTVEVGSGIHDFVNDIFKHPALFHLTATPKKTGRTKTFVHDTEAEKHGRPDFVLYINKDITIPCEVKCFGRIADGLKQLKRYQLDYTKEYGILTDGFEWRFYRAHSYQVLTIEQILSDPQKFLTLWNNYLKPENYYLELFQPTGQGIFFDDPLGLNDAENRSIFFKDTSKIISNFRTKIKIDDDKTAIETAYAYLIQFIMYKVLVDNRFQKFENDYKLFRRQVVEAIRNKDLYNLVVSNIRNISEYIAKNIYRPFAEEQQGINEILIADLSRELLIDDIAPWLDIIEFINKYDFANLQNEIFGFVYENYLKDLYGDKPKGQFFTDPAVVNFMLDELGYTSGELAKDKTKISIIDPACGAGTFLYSAADRIIRALDTKGTKEQALAVKDLVEKNVFGLDIAKFPLYLAELCILVDMLPLIVNDRFVQPVEHKLKLFKTRDSISEFIDTGISAQESPVDLFSHIQEMSLDYKSFMRDDENLVEMLRSMQGNKEERLRFDFVVSNPPYIGYNDCCRQKAEFTQRIKEYGNPSISLADVYGVNLHSVPGKHKKYSPKPNLYAFFTALGLGLLKDDGKLCFIIPQTLLTAGDLDVLRYHLAKNMTIKVLITFEGNLFIGRGLMQNKPIATSSLIIIVQKASPAEKHKVRVVNYKPYSRRQGKDFGLYLRSKNKETKTVLQRELLEKVENWNFILQDSRYSDLMNIYVKNSLSIEEYRKNVLADYNEICIDGGVKLDENKISTVRQGKQYRVFNPKINSVKTFRTKETNLFYDKSEKIVFLQCTQGMRVFNNKYKILWKTRFNNRFQYSEEQDLILHNNQTLMLSSNNKSELLFLLGLLNSRLSLFMLEKSLKMPNESTYIVAMKSVKQYIRIPKITAKNQKLKDKIIAKTEALLALEDVVLRDIVDFGKLNVQRFDSINVVGNEMILTNSREYRCKIQPGKSALVQKVVRETYQQGGLITEGTVTLQELKTLPVIDFDKQVEIKKQIDDWVYALYFDVAAADVEQHEFYGYVHP